MADTNDSIYSSTWIGNQKSQPGDAGYNKGFYSSPWLHMRTVKPRTASTTLAQTNLVKSRLSPGTPTYNAISGRSGVRP